MLNKLYSKKLKVKVENGREVAVAYKTRVEDVIKMLETPERLAKIMAVRLNNEVRNLDHEIVEDTHIEYVEYGCNDGYRIYCKTAKFILYMAISRLYPDFKFRYYCDKDEKKQKEGFMGLPVLSPEELISKSDDVYVVVNTANYHCEIVDFLISNGFKKDKIFDFGAISEELYKNQYFDLNIMQPRQEELFIDGGCFDCGTDIQFIEWCGGQYNKIYAFEPDKMNYMKCLKKRDEKGISNISIYNKGLWDTATELSFTANGNGSSRVVGEQEENVITIDTVCIDDVVSEEKVSLIKLDVEGAELKALQGAQKTIKRDRPRLAVCIYHKPQDIVEILEFILSLHDDYKLYIRHYHYEYIETVVYAI